MDKYRSTLIERHDGAVCAVVLVYDPATEEWVEFHRTSFFRDASIRAREAARKVCFYDYCRGQKIGPDTIPIEEA